MACRCRRHEQRAADEAAALEADAKPETIVRLATRFPVAGIAAGLWERAAEAYRPRVEIMRWWGRWNLRWRRRSGSRAPRVGEVGGGLIAELKPRQQYAAAGKC